MRYISHLLIFLLLVFSPCIVGCSSQVSIEEAERIEAEDAEVDSGEEADDESGEDAE